MLSITHNLKDVIRDVEKFEKAVQPAQAAALNKTMSQARTAASKEIRAEYKNIKLSDLKDNKVDKANPRNLKTVLTPKGRRIPLSRFIAGGFNAKNIAKSKRKFEAYRQISGVPVEVKKGAPKILKHSFIVGLASGHVGVFVRGGKARFPIGGFEQNKFTQKHEVLGPAPWQMYENEKISKAITDTYDKKYEGILMHEMQFRTGSLFTE